MKLFEPGQIGKLKLKNRIIMAAMATGALCDASGRISPRGIDYFVARAKGGVGMVMTNSSPPRLIEPADAAPLLNDLIIDGKKSAGWLSELVDAVHDYGAKMAIQISCGGGRNVGLEVIRKGMAVAPSPLPCFFDPNEMTRELSTKEVEALTGHFQFVAEACCLAGVDAIEVNNHAGYLPDEFLTALWNKRTDKYGGDLDGRLTFLREILAAMKRGAGDDFPILVKYGLTHYLPGGREIDEGLEIAKKLEKEGVAALVIEAGCYENWYRSKPSTYSPPGALVALAELTKKAVSIPVVAIGKLGYPDVAEMVLQDGKADFIQLGRPLLADPDWPNKVKEGRLEDIRPCMYCHEACSARIAKGRYVSCVTNPACGMEREFTISPARKSKRVLVIGGGPGGMEAARVAALKGHKVTLYEKGYSLGGSLIPASVPDFKQDYRNLIEYLSTQISKLGVEVKLATEATPNSILAMKPEVVFLATGNMPIIPKIPGINRNNVVLATDALLGKKEVGKTVVVIGGGMVGCEVALYFAQKGRKVTIVEILDAVARDMHLANREHLLQLLSDNHVTILTNTDVKRISVDGVAIVAKSGAGKTLKAETVVIAVGFKPRETISQALIDKLPEVYTLGDCVQPRKVQQAIWEGFRTARLV